MQVYTTGRFTASSEWYIIKSSKIRERNAVSPALMDAASDETMNMTATATVTAIKRQNEQQKRACETRVLRMPLQISGVLRQIYPDVAVQP